MDVLWWILMPVVVSAGSGLLTYKVMQSRIEVVRAGIEKELAEAQAALAASRELAGERLKAGEEAARRKAFDDFLADVRIEERHYLRESRSLLASRRYMVLQERVCFRNIPLSDWTQKELLVEEGSDLDKLARPRLPEPRLAGPRLLT
jgi:hypothetical protein